MAAPAQLSDRQVQIETPEHVDVGYEIADLGSRFTALLIDAVFLFGGASGVWVILWQVMRVAPDAADGVLTAVGIIASFVLVWGYFVWFEGFRDGQTPGKRRVGIRAVYEGGYPLDARGAAIRGLVRLVDVQPFPTCLLGGAVMMFHPRTQRLGDMAAGTLVVRERSGAAMPEEAAADASASTGPPRLTPEEFATLSRYVERRATLPAEARATIAGRLVEHLGARLPDDATRRHSGYDEWLVRLHRDEASRRTAAGASGAAGSAQAVALYRRQRGTWDEYRALLELAGRRGLDALPEREVSRFAALYREVAADLARARTYGGSPELVYSLERAVGAGHNLLYRPAPRSWRALRTWLTGGFPALARRRWRPIAIASALFYVPALIAYGLVRMDPPRANELMPAVMLERAEEAEAKERRGEGYVEVTTGEMPEMATGLIANNVQVTFTAFAGGILAGAGTVLTLVFNGILLGGIAGLFANHGQALHLFTFVLPHGVVELTAICIAGGAGLWMGSAFLLPGRRTRREVLVERGREAVSLICGTAMLLVVAGFIEGFVSPSQLPREVKLGFAALVAVVLVAYLGGAGRDEEARIAARDVARRDPGRR